MTDFIQQAKDMLKNANPKKQRALTAEEQEKVDAFTARLTAPPPDTGKEGNAHWLASPHGASDAYSPHRLVGEDENPRTLADVNEEMEERAEDQANNPLVVRPR